MPPKKKCSCKMHDCFASGKMPQILRIDGKKIKQAIIRHLINKGYLFTQHFLMYIV